MTVTAARQRIATAVENNIIDRDQAIRMQKAIDRVSREYRGKMRARQLEAWSDPAQVN